jgi:hypothetical protein
MRRVIGALVLVGCGSKMDAGGDAAVVDAAVIDAAPDACVPTALLVGGMDAAAQGWTVVMEPPATLTYGADYTELLTTTPSGGRTGGQLLLSRALAPPFALEIVMQVVASAPHNPLDASAAILGAFTAPFGSQTERSQMIYLDAAALGWADDTQRTPADLTDGRYHTYVVTVDGAAARVILDGYPALARADFGPGGTIAIGDQTNDARLDSTLRIRSVRQLCR